MDRNGQNGQNGNNEQNQISRVVSDDSVEEQRQAARQRDRQAREQELRDAFEPPRNNPAPNQAPRLQRIIEARIPNPDVPQPAPPAQAPQPPQEVQQDDTFQERINQQRNNNPGRER
ncbi:MAG: hypothetical protein PQ612_07845 [Rickettsiales bacterium]|nr:hypothetical protein [Pseudomonadota bacterium]MDA0967000.1 hypothetical protein [Pseudomonadota bacterium]MDG4543920.1 hypothetical protein [Rickettsiales bacterium]MDG4546066.1 hypothetical protein [Rickettsiales bacterium]MDG4548312.1 hypothetical protein [Rickettsiales bacterium]